MSWLRRSYINTRSYIAVCREYAKAKTHAPASSGHGASREKQILIQSNEKGENPHGYASTAMKLRHWLLVIFTQK